MVSETLGTEPRVANAEQASVWDGEEGEHWSEHADHYDAAVRRYDQHLLDAACLADDDWVLDIGCGAGATTRDASRVAVAGGAVGIDLSGRLVAEARRRSTAAGIANTTFLQGDAQVYPSTPKRSMSPSADSGPCSSGIRSRRSPTSAAPYTEATCWPCWLGESSRQRVDSGPAPQPGCRAEPPGATGRGAGPLRPGRRSTHPAHFGQRRLRPRRAGRRRRTCPAGCRCRRRLRVRARSRHHERLIEGLDHDARQRALDELRALLATRAGPDGVLLDGSAWLITARAR